MEWIFCNRTVIVPKICHQRVNIWEFIKTPSSCNPLSSPKTRTAVQKAADKFYKDIHKQKIFLCQRIRHFIIFRFGIFFPLWYIFILTWSALHRLWWNRKADWYVFSKGSGRNNRAINSNFKILWKRKIIAPNRQKQPKIQAIRKEIRQHESSNIWQQIFTYLIHIRKDYFSIDTRFFTASCTNLQPIPSLSTLVKIPFLLSVAKNVIPLLSSVNPVM